MNRQPNAPGWPGIAATWTSSAKSGVGTARNDLSRIWFTISHGILNEIYYPRVDHACTRDCGFIITDGRSFFSEEKRHTEHRVEYIAEGVPGFKLTNTCKEGRYTIEKEIITNPSRNTVIQKVEFTANQGKLEDYHLYVVIAPHLANSGSGNTAWVGEHKSIPMLFAQKDGFALAVACSEPWLHRSAGFVGRSDGWHDLHENKQLTAVYDRAENGNVALIGEIDLSGNPRSIFVSLAFGLDPWGAGYYARSSLHYGYEKMREEYIDGWRKWNQTLAPIPEEPDGSGTGRDLFAISTAVMHSHEAQNFPGGIIASLSVPWGQARGDEDLGGYHLVWPRDLVETATALLSTGVKDLPLRVLRYLRATQDHDGRWPQNMWLSGKPYWGGVQMDETSFPILLIEHARRDGLLKDDQLREFWTMVKRAASYLVVNGPVTQEDRWESDSGYSPFTLAAEISALLAAADVADIMGEGAAGAYMRETADNWNENIERWTYVEDTDADRHAAVSGHYVRIGPGGTAGPEKADKRLAYLVGPDALAFVRFGLRRPDDERIVNTVKVVDTYLKMETPYGPSWRRYPGDTYGEFDDGSPPIFYPSGVKGIGRSWPLLTGERAHYELALGNRADAEGLLHTMERFSNEGGMIPEQVWDSADIPERELWCGRPSGSAMPLVWAHAEYVKLRRSLSDGSIYDMPGQTRKRYLEQNVRSAYAAWRFNNKCIAIPAGKTLRVELLARARVRWTCDEWESLTDTETMDTTLGVFIADLPVGNHGRGTSLEFTIYWIDAGRWENRNFRISIGAGG